jgi:hypothetical protein
MGAVAKSDSDTRIIKNVVSLLSDIYQMLVYYEEMAIVNKEEKTEIIIIQQRKFI